MKRLFFPLIFLTAMAAPLARATTVALAVSPIPATYGKLITITATLTPPTATGTVTFYDGVNVLEVEPVANGVATLKTAQLGAGSHQVSARYNGDVNDAAASSGAVAETVTSLAGQSFGEISPVNSGQQPQFVAVGDFNGDGILDLVAPTYSQQTGTFSQVVVLLGAGNGTFPTQNYVKAGTNIQAVAVGDFNGDGKQDLVVVDEGEPPTYSGTVNVLLGNGNGTFDAPVLYSEGYSGFFVVVGDFNRDGIEDIAVANNAGSTDVSVLLGVGNGTFQAPTNYETGTTSGAFGLAIGDFNGDGYPDLAVAEDNVVILLGTASGTFQKGQTIAAETEPSSIATADFNGDGKADLAVSNFYNSTVSILVGNGNGTFQTQVPYAVGSDPTFVTTSDFNGDGKQDLAVANSAGQVGYGSVSVLLNNGNGTFGAATNYPTLVGPFVIATGDFTGQGIADIAVADLGDTSTVPPNYGDVSVLTSHSCATVSPVGVYYYGANGGSPTFTVTTSGSNCSWTASTNVPWIFLTSSGGTGSEPIAATVTQNTSGADRTGTITIAGQTITVNEAFTVQEFSDVPPGEYYFDAVNLLADKGITTGCASDQYCPTADITRAQMAVFIVRMVYNGSDNFTYNPVPYFQDVTPTTFGFKWIQKLFELGITTGCAPNLFCPTENVARDQMAIFIIRGRYSATTNFTYPLTPYFTDVPPSYFAFEWIQRLKKDEITSGCTATTYCPAELVDRGDMALFVMRGGFNEVLAAPMPIISAVSPAYATLARGTSATFTVTGEGTNFVQGVTTVVPVGGVTASNLVVHSPTQFTVTLSASPTALQQPEPVYVQTEPQEAVFPNAFTVQ